MTPERPRPVPRPAARGISNKSELAVAAVLALAILLGGFLYSMRGVLDSECGGFSCEPGSNVLPGKGLDHFVFHASAACAWTFDDLTPAAVDAAKTYAQRTYPVGEYAEIEHKTAYLGCLQGIWKPLHTPSLWVSGFGAYEVYDSAARDCAGRGVGRVAREFEVAPTPAEAARAYAEYKYPTGRAAERGEAFEGCLEALVGPPRQALPKTDVRVTVPGLQGLRITWALHKGVHHYFVSADSPRHLLAGGWMTPLFDSLDFRGVGAHPVRVHLYTSGGQLVLTAGKSTNGYDAWMQVSREWLVPCGPVWYGSIPEGKRLDGPDPDLPACPNGPVDRKR